MNRIHQLNFLLKTTISTVFLSHACAGILGFAVLVCPVHAENNPVLQQPSLGQRGNYNIKAGPVEVKINAGVKTTYNDNINLSEVDRLDDVIITPYTNIAAVWPMTQQNTLRVGLGISYNKHIFNPEADSNAPILSPDSQTGFEFEIKVDDFRFNIYDYISYEQDPIDNGSISNSLNYGRFINRVGVDGTWDLNDVELMLGVFQENYWSTSNEFEFLDRSTQGVKGRATFHLGPETVTGIQGTGTLNSFDENFQNDSMRLTVGPFIRSKLSEHISVGGEANVELGEFDQGGLNGDQEDLLSYSLKGEIRHRLNRRIEHDLMVARNVDLGTFTNYAEIWEVRHNSSWNVVQNVVFSTTAFVEFGDESGSFSSDSYIRYGAGCSIGYAWTKKLTSSLSYLYIEKDSQLFLRDYYQNKVTLDIRYTF